MTALIVIALVVLTLVVFAMEWMDVEVYSLLLISGLVVGGILTPAQGFAGFASSTVLMIAGIMLLTGALLHNGVVELISRKVQAIAGASERRSATLLISSVNGLSAIINNVAATAVFIPVAEAVALRFAQHRTKYLMGVAFASMTGGMCTLIGTSTNVAVSGALPRYGLAELSMFELAPVGVPVALLGVLYLVWIAPRLIPEPSDAGDAERYRIQEFVYEVEVLADCPLAGKTLAEGSPETRFNIRVLAIVRGAERIDAPEGAELLLPGDLLLVQGRASAIDAIQAAPGFRIRSLPEPDGTAAARWLPSGARVVEATVSFNSPLIGKTLKEIGFRQAWGLSVLAIQRREETLVDKIGKISLRAGDVLLVYGTAGAFERIEAEPSVLLIQDTVFPRYDRVRARASMLVFVATIVAATTGWLDPPTAFLAGAAVVLAAGLLPRNDVGGYLNIRFLVMLAGMAALGVAMEVSGAAKLLADLSVAVTGNGQPVLLMAAFFTLTVILTQPLNNAAAALLVLPIAMQAAIQQGFDARAFAILVTLAASCSFITPFEPACLLVYGTGHYHFRDFVRVGLPLTVIAGIVSLLIVPVLWPLTP